VQHSTTIPDWLRPDVVGQWGRRLLIGAFALTALLWGALLWTFGPWVAALPAVLVAGAAAVFLAQRPAMNLYVVLAGFVVVIDYNESASAIELLYGAYFIFYLSSWLIRHRVLEGKKVLHSPLDAFVALFLFWATASLGLSIIYGADMIGAAGEWMAVMMFGAYFPIREVVRTERRGPDIVVGILIWLGLFVTIRNLYLFASIIGNATMMWQVMSGRVVTNMSLLLLPTIFLVILLAYQNDFKRQIPLFLAFSAGLMSLVLTQARAYWIDFAFAAGFILLFVGWTQRRRLLIYATAGVLGALLAGYLLLGDTLFVLLAGLFDRLMSIATATERDISLINRFYEAGDVWEYIKESPIIGHGLATTYRTFDLIIYATITKPFAHIGYVMLWFKYGIIGLLTVLLFWGGGIWTGYRVFRDERSTGRNRLYALAAFICLIGLFPSSFTSVPFYLSDDMLSFGLLLAVCEGLRRRLLTTPAAS